MHRDGIRSKGLRYMDPTLARGEAITLKDIKAARTAHRRALRQQLTSRSTAVAAFLPTPRRKRHCHSRPSPSGTPHRPLHQPARQISQQAVRPDDLLLGSGVGKQLVDQLVAEEITNLEAKLRVGG